MSRRTGLSFADQEFDWSLIRSFLAILEYGSLTAAARSTGISQPTLGRHVDELERQLGLVLFERKRTGLHPTPQATALRESAEQMSQGARSLQRLASGLDSSVSGQVHITASQSLAVALLPPLIARLNRKHPDIEILLAASNQIADLASREADIAIRMVEPTQSTLIARQLGSVSVVACASKAYLREHPHPQAAADLFAHRVIAGDRNNELSDYLQRAGYPIEQLRYGLRSDDLMVQWEAIRAGLGIGFLVDCLVGSDPDVCRVLPDMPLPAFPIWLTVHREVRSNARVRASYDFLAAAITQALAD